MKRVIVTVGAIVIFGTSLLSTAPAYANQTIDNKIVENQQEQLKVNEQIEKLQQAIEDNQKTVAESEENIKQVHETIEQLNVELSAIEEKIAKREDLIKARLQVMQKGGGTFGYIEVLLGASDFDDLISRVSAIATITKADQDLMGEQQKDKKSLEKKEKAKQDELTELNDLKIEYEGMQGQIAEQKEHAEKMKAQLESEEQQLIVEKEEEERRAVESEAANTQYVNEINRPAGNYNNISASSNTDNLASNNATKKSTPSTNGNSAIVTVTSVGNRFIGNSVYVFGAQDATNGRFDCSGFVNWAFKQAGINIGRSTSVLSTQGTKVSTSDMRPGDLVFFDTYKKNGHVGIYLGGGKFIGSQSSTGVAVANMTSGYYKQHFDGHVRRIIQ